MRGAIMANWRKLFQLSPRSSFADYWWLPGSTAAVWSQRHLQDPMRICTRLASASKHAAQPSAFRTLVWTIMHFPQPGPCGIS